MSDSIKLNTYTLSKTTDDQLKVIVFSKFQEIQNRHEQQCMEIREQLQKMQQRQNGIIREFGQFKELHKTRERVSGQEYGSQSFMQPSDLDKCGDINRGFDVSMVSGEQRGQTQPQCHVVDSSLGNVPLS